MPAVAEKTRGGECAMLNLSHSLIICSSLLLLMFLVAGTWGGKAVAGRMGVENPYIKKGVLPPFSPESLCSDVQSGFVLPVCCAQFQGLSPVRGCNSDSIPTLGHTSVSSFAERSLSNHIICLVVHAILQLLLKPWSPGKVLPRMQSHAKVELCKSACIPDINCSCQSLKAFCNCNLATAIVTRCDLI